MTTIITVRIQAESKDEAMNFPATYQDIRTVMEEFVQLATTAKGLPPGVAIRWLLIPGRWE